MSFIGNRGLELQLALTLLTRLPLPQAGKAADERMRAAVWAYPVVGAMVGLVGAGAFGLGAAIGLPPMPAAALALAAMTALTGALHEDGLADTVDGLGGGRTRERKLEIMRDSRIGTFGTLSLVIGFAVKWSALAELAAPGLAGPALVVAHALSRGAIAVPLVATGPARADGLGLTASAPPPPAAAAAIGLAAVLAILLLSTAAALCAVAAGLAAAGFVTWLARRQIGGFTGDVLGAVQQAAEMAVLVVAVTLLR